MNILYWGDHSILEHDEVRLFTEMGHKVFSLGGVYQNENLGDNLRGPIPNFEIQKITDNPQTKDNVGPDLLKWMDISIITHNHPSKEHPQPWIANNWKLLKATKKPIVFRSIGQSNVVVEEALTPFKLDGLKIVRYSPKEKNIPSFCGEDAMIRFYLDPEEYKGYTGNISRIVNVSQGMFGSDTQVSRGDWMAKNVFDEVVKDLDWKIFGPGNDFAGEHNGGALSHEDLKTMLRLNRVFLYCGTRPAPYTLGFMEALATGIPVVSIGPKNGNTMFKQDTFEAHEIIGPNGEAGFWSDNPEELRNFCKMLLDNHDLAKQIGQKGREKAIEYFGKDKIKKEWQEFFSKIC